MWRHDKTILMPQWAAGSALFATVGLSSVLCELWVAVLLKKTGHSKV
jgi:hypothetical protein